jgi:hypothetical protein
MRRICALTLGVSFALSILAAGIAYASDPPPNDNVAAATTVSAFPFTGTVDVAAATVESGEPSCGGTRTPTRSIWYRVTAPDDGAVEVQVSGWTAGQYWLSRYAPEGVGFGGLTYQSPCRAGSPWTLMLTSGQTTYIQLADDGTAGSSVTVSFVFYPPPANDNFADATVVTRFPSSFSADLWGATVETGEKNPCGVTARTRTIWYAITPTANGQLTADASRSAFASPVIAAYIVLPAGGLSAGLCGSGGVVTVPVSAGRTYYVQLSDSGPNPAGTGWGTANVDFMFVPTPPGPANDNYASATEIASFPFGDSVNVQYATLESSEPNPCRVSWARTIWYTFTAATSGVVTVHPATWQLSGIRATAYRATGTGLSGLTALACGNYYEASAPFRVEAGSRYAIQVSDPGTGPGTATVSMDFAPGTSPANDDFANAAVVGALPFTDSVSLAGATQEIGEDPSGGCGSYVGASVWYRYTPSADATISVGTAGSTGSVNVSAYRLTGSGIPGLTGFDLYAACAQVFNVRAGATYYVRVAAQVYTTPGTAQVRITAVEPPPNDDLADAVVVTALPFEGEVDVRAATRETGEPHPCSDSTHTVWYSVTAPTGGSLLAEGIVLPDPVVAVYRRATDGSLAFLACGQEQAASVTVTAGETYLVQASDWFTGGGGMRVRITFTDTTPPTITYGAHPATYTVDETVSITCAASDAMGIAWTTCVDMRSAAWQLGPGTHVLSATATDNAGNVATESTSFEVRVTYPAMDVLTAQLVSKPGVAAQLIGYLDAAAKAEAKGNLKAEASNLESYRSLLAAQTGKAVGRAEADALAALSRLL